MHLQLLNFKCGQCTRSFSAPVMPAGTHGEFVLRSTGSLEEVYLDARRDQTYDEVEILINRNPVMLDKDEWYRAHVLQKAYGEIACDPDSTGSPFSIGKLPNCPHCGSANAHSWRFVDPPQFLDKALPPVTHHEWAGLSPQRKQARVDAVLASRGF